MTSSVTRCGLDKNDRVIVGATYQQIFAFIEKQDFGWMRVNIPSLNDLAFRDIDLRYRSLPPIGSRRRTFHLVR